MNLLNNRLTGHVLMLEIMEIYGWDYYTYINQPAWVLRLVIKKLDIQTQIRANKEKING